MMSMMALAGMTAAPAMRAYGCEPTNPPPPEQCPLGWVLHYCDVENGQQVEIYYCSSNPSQTISRPSL